MGLCYGLKPDDRIFPYRKEFLHKIMNEGCKRSGVKKIRVHDTRHSHASLLVEKGFSPLLIAERLGHEKVQTTMDIYSQSVPEQTVGSSQKAERDDRRERCRLGKHWLQKRRKNVIRDRI